MTTDFQIPNLPTLLTEGELYSFVVMPKAALAEPTKIRWEIVAVGELPTSAADFVLTEGERTLSGSAAQVIEIRTRDDAIPESRGHFEVRVYQIRKNGTEDLIDSQIVVLNDNDTPPEDPVPTIRGDAGDNILTIGSDSDAIYDGGEGDDAYIVTRYHTGHAVIEDSGIRSASEKGIDTVFVDVRVDSEQSETEEGHQLLTLATGGTVLLKGSYKVTYPIIPELEPLNFKDYINNPLGLIAADRERAKKNKPLLPEPEAAGSDTLPLQNVVGDTAENILTASGNAEAKLFGGRGDDVYVIGRFQKSDVRILDFTDDNLVKFDYGVTIIGFEETTMRAGTILSELTLTLENEDAEEGDKPEVVIRYPAKFFRYQLGDEAVQDYAEFKAFLTADEDALPFTITQPDIA